MTTERKDIEREIATINRQFNEGKLKKREYYKKATPLYQIKALLDISDLASDGYEASPTIKEEAYSLSLKNQINTESQFNRMRDRFRRDRIKTNAKKTVAIEEWRVGSETAKLTKPIEIKISANTRNEPKAVAKKLIDKVNTGLDYATDNYVNQDVARTYYNTIVGGSINQGEQIYTGDEIKLSNMRNDLKTVLEDRRIDRDVINRLSDSAIETLNEDLKTILQIPHLSPRTYSDFRTQRANQAYYTLMNNVGASQEIADLLRIAISNSSFWKMLIRQGFDSDQIKKYFELIAAKTQAEINLNGKNSMVLDDLLSAAVNSDFTTFDDILRNHLGTTIFTN